MIPLQFGLFWCGGNISYLRYVTFKTLRHFHPDSKIQLYVSKNCNKNIHKWGDEKQDFETGNVKDYLHEIKDLGVEVIEMDAFGSASFCPIFQADIFRWWWLYNFGGFYLDTDQIILKNLSCFTDISFQPSGLDFIYSRFSNADRPNYTPTGFLGCCKNSEIAKVMMQLVPKAYSFNSYNSSGPFILEYAVLNFFPAIGYNAPYQKFYPINCSRDVNTIYDGSFQIPEDSVAMHWYGGHPLSQEFNKKYTEEFAKTSNDVISKFLRENGLL